MNSVYQDHYELALKLAKNTIIAWQPSPRFRGRYNPQATRFFLNNGQILDLFCSSPVYYLTKDRYFRPISEISDNPGNKNIHLSIGWENRIDFGYLVWLVQRCSLLGGNVYLPMSVIPLVINTLSTFNPDANPETTSVDGAARASSNVWATARAATTAAEVSDSDAGTGIDHADARFISPNYTIWRDFLLFDTSALPDSDTISAATLTLYGTANTPDNADSTDYDVVSSSPASNTALVADDYDNIGSTVFGSIAASSWNGANGAANIIALNANGIANISKIGISKFGCRNSRDTDDAAPTGSNTGSWWHADHGSNKPTLSVTHASDFITNPTLLLMGVG